MDKDHSVKTRNFLITVFRTFDVSNDGRLSRGEVDRVLAALGRRSVLHLLPSQLSTGSCAVAGYYEII
jgi:Ca2+-binding EF-hand superfamily protein